MRKFTKQHEWIDVAGDVGTVGITDFAQHQLGDVIFVDLPAVGKNVKQADAVAVVESVKAASDIYSPVSGEIVEVNSELIKSPELVNTNPDSNGWFFKIKLTNTDEFGALMSREDYEEFVK